MERATNRIYHVASFLEAEANREDVVGFELEVVDHQDAAEILLRSFSTEDTLGGIVCIELRVDEMVVGGTGA